jgi:hypothetical protein
MKWRGARVEHEFFFKSLIGNTIRTIISYESMHISVRLHNYRCWRFRWKILVYVSAVTAFLLCWVQNVRSPCIVAIFIIYYYTLRPPIKCVFYFLVARNTGHDFGILSMAIVSRLTVILVDLMSIELSLELINQEVLMVSFNG